MTTSSADKFEAWAVVELFGHQRVAGRISDQAIGGDPNTVCEELVDVLLLADVFAGYAGWDMREWKRQKMKTLLQRAWEPDGGGALYRPGQAL